MRSALAVSGFCALITGSGALSVARARGADLSAAAGPAVDAAGVTVLVCFTVLLAAHRGGQRQALPVTVPALLLAAIGLPMTWRLDASGGGGRQSVVAVVAAAVFLVLVTAAPTMAWLGTHAKLVALVGTAMLLLPFAPGVGYVSHGARAWVVLPGIGQIQPGEVARVLLILSAAAFVTRAARLLSYVGPHHGRLLAVRPLFTGVSAAVAGVLLLVAQRDLGPALLLTCSVAVVVWVASGRVRYLVLTLGALTAGAVAVYPFLPYLHIRVAAWKDPLGLGGGGLTQGGTAELAMAWAGWFGPGLGRGPGTRVPGRIPEAANDYVLAQFGAELGVAYVLVILVVLGVWLTRCWRAVLETSAGYPAAAGAGLVTLLSVQTTVVAAGVLGLMPLTGITTPLLSAGGSSLLSVALTVALIARLPAARRTPAELCMTTPSGLAARPPAPSRLSLLSLTSPGSRLGMFARRRHIRLVAPGESAPLPSRTHRRVRTATVVTSAGVAAAAGAAVLLPFEPVDRAPFNPYRNWSAALHRGRILAADGTVLARTDGMATFDAVQRHYGAPGWPADAVSSVTGWTIPMGRSDGVERAWAGALRCSAVPALQDTIGSLGAPLPPESDPRSCAPADVRTTISSKWQLAARRALGERRGAVVVLNVRTGAVLALVATPLVDAQTLTGLSPKVGLDAYAAAAGDPREPLASTATSVQLPPGSTFKLVTAAAALRTGHADALPRRGYLRLTEVQVLGGPAGVCGGQIPEALSVSCNPAFAEWALRTGGPEILASARAAGFDTTRLSGVPLAPATLGRAGAAPSLAAGNSGVVDSLTAVTGIGQGEVRATPTHIAAIASVVASGGTYREPYLVGGIERDGRTLWRAVPRARSAWSPAQTGVIAEGMREAATTGTARALVGVPGHWAAKTGTAQWQGSTVGWVAAYSTSLETGEQVAVAVVLPPWRPADSLTGTTTSAHAIVSGRSGGDAVQVLAAMARSAGHSR